MEDVSRLPTSDLLDRAAALARGAAEDNDEYWFAVVALRQRPDRSVFERAAGWCTSADPRLRSSGASVLAQLGAPTCPFATESAPIVVGLLRDSDGDVVSSALYALGHLRAGATADIAAFAQDGAASVRAAAAFALGGRDEPTALTALQLLTADPDYDVRNWATFGLGTQCQSDSAEIRDALAARLGDEGEIRGEAIVGLARRHDVRATEAIATELMGDEVQVLAIEAAELMPSRRFVPALRALLEAEPSDAVRRALQACEAVDEPSRASMG